MHLVVGSPQHNVLTGRTRRRKPQPGSVRIQLKAEELFWLMGSAGGEGKSRLGSVGDSRLANNSPGSAYLPWVSNDTNSTSASPWASQKAWRHHEDYHYHHQHTDISTIIDSSTTSNASAASISSRSSIMKPYEYEQSATAKGPPTASVPAAEYENNQQRQWDGRPGHNRASTGRLTTPWTSGGPLRLS